MANQKPTQQMDEAMHSRKRQNNSKSLFVTVSFLVLLVILGIVLWLLFRPKEEPNSIIVTEENKDIIQEELTKKVAEGMYEAKMNTNWEFEDSKTASSNAYVENAINNAYTVYFDLILDSTNETVFTSPYIPVGSYLKNLTLEKELDAGIYDATVVYYLVDDTGKELSDVAVTVTLNILN